MEGRQDFVRLLRKRMGGRYLIALVAGLIAGNLTHLYMIANKITNLDDISGIPGVGGGAALGRWLQPRLHHLFSVWSAPAINGEMSILFLSLAACLMILLLEIRTEGGAALAAILLVTFPSVTSNMYYMLLAPTFALAVLMSVLGVYLTRHYRFGWIFGVILQILSMACYQAYFAVAASLYVLLLILMLTDGKKVTEAFWLGVKFLMTLALSMAGYLISVRIVGEELADYKGLNSIGSFSPVSLLHAFLRCYHRLMQYFITAPESYMAGAPALFNRLSVIAAVILIPVIFCQRKLYTERSRAVIWGILLAALLPFAMSVFYLMAPELDRASTVMTFSYVIFDLMILALCERLRLPGEGKARPALRALLIATFLILCCKAYSVYRVANIAYYRSYIAQERTVNYLNRIYARLEEQGDYRYGDRVAILGGFYPDPIIIGRYQMGGEKLIDLEGATLEDHLFLPANRLQLERVFLGIDSEEVTEEERDAIMKKDAFARMPAYPEDGCIQRIDGIWVVKIAEDDR